MSSLLGDDDVLTSWVLERVPGVREGWHVPHQLGSGEGSWGQGGLEALGEQGPHQIPAVTDSTVGL